MTIHLTRIERAVLPQSLAYCQYIGFKDAHNPWERTTNLFRVQLKGAVDAMTACIGAGKSLNGLKIKYSTSDN